MGKLVPVGRETDRRWEQSEDPSMLEFNVLTYSNTGKMLIADATERKKWAAISLRRWKRETRLSQKAVYAVLAGKPVRKQTLAAFRGIAEKLFTASL